MRLAYASDLHADLCDANEEFLSHLATHLQRESPDVFVLAGDLAESVATVEASLNVFRDVPGEHIYLPGNHTISLPRKNRIRHMS